MTMTTLTMTTLTMIQSFQGPVTRGVPRRASLLLSEEPARVRAATPAPHVQAVAEELRVILAEEEQAEADLADGLIGEATMRALGMGDGLNEEDGLNEYRALKEELRALGSEDFEAELALGEAAMQEFEAELPAMQELEQARLAAAEAEKERALATMQARGMEAGLSGEANKVRARDTAGVRARVTDGGRSDRRSEQGNRPEFPCSSPCSPHPNPHLTSP